MPTLPLTQQRLSIRIAVSDPLPIYRRGMIAALGDAGFQPETPEDLLTWSRQEERPFVLLTLQSARDWSVLKELRDGCADLVVIALLTDPSVQNYVKAIVTGAAAAVPRDESPETMQRVFDQAVKGMTLLPIEVVQALSEWEETSSSEAAPVAREIEWLRKLAEGVTVAQLAEQVGYSERAMFRLLRGLYTRMNVSSRTEALMLAHRRGWL